MNRKDFLYQGAALAVGSALLASCKTSSKSIANKRDKGIGIQLFSIPKLMEKDFEGTLKMLAQIGYKEIEFYGPYTFSVQQDKDSWNAITPQLGFSGSGFYGRTPQQAKKILDDNGLTAPSLHTSLNTLKENMGALAEAAHVIGATYVVLPSAATPPDLEGYKKQAAEFNAIGAEAAKHDLQFAYHNHGNGLKAIDGKVPLELVLEATDPKLVAYEMDIFWTTAAGIDPVMLLDKYPGRYKMMHVKDMSKAVGFSGDGGDPQQWMALFPYLADAGSGVLDLKNIIAHAEKSGVEHFIIERDLAPQPEEALQKGYNCLKSLL